MTIRYSGHVELAILRYLASREMHGYDLVKSLKASHPDVLTGGEGTVYPLLLKMERDGLVVSRWDERRKLYALTAKGRRAFEAKKRSWRKLSEAIEHLLLIGPDGAGA